MLDGPAGYVLVLLLGYALGSIPNASIATRMISGQDVRDLGTGNAGAANVFREVSPVAGAVVALVDIAKGLIPVLIADRLLDLGPAAATLAGAGALWGHQYSILLRFRGGAGLAAATGAVAGLLFGPFLLVAAVGAVLVISTRNMGWSGGATLGLMFLLAALSLWTESPVPPDGLAVSSPGYLYGAVIIGALLAVPFWTRLLQRRVASHGGGAATDSG